MISFRQLALRRGERLLLSNVDLTLHAGWRIGVVGRNGAGKSSLFAALLGELEPDRGTLELPARTRIASVAQETPALPQSAREFVLSGDEAIHAALQMEAQALMAEDWETVAVAHQRLEALGGYDGHARAGRLLHGLGFPAEVHEKPVAEFSGGWRVRLNVARALMTPSDLLLLDEPTNHLDLDAVVWLEEWLERYAGTVLVISHDREFLDSITTHILHLHDGTAKLYAGNYTDFERQRAEHLRQQQIAHEKAQAERAHLQSFIDRFKAKASKARQAQSRMKRLEKLAGTEAVRVERALRIRFPDPLKLPDALLSLRGVDCGYGAQAKILARVDFALEAGDRIGLLGPNGAGKSTLVKTLVGELAPLSGERRVHPDLRIGYFAQHTVESLVAGASPLDHLRALDADAPNQTLRDFLGQWNFPGERAFEAIDTFSGGEKARLALALLAYRRPNVLLLDEPTNHLDLDMREALAEALAGFEGAIVLVSHDRHLIGLVCDRFWRVAGGKVEPFAGDLDDYAAWLRTRHRDGDESRMPADTREAPTAAASRQTSSASGSGRSKVNPYKLQKAEEKVARLEHQLAECEAQLMDPAIYADADRVAGLSRQRHQLRAELDAAEAELLELYAT